MLFAFAASLREEFSELCEGTVDRPGETHQATISAMVLIVCTSYLYMCQNASHSRCPPGHNRTVFSPEHKLSCECGSMLEHPGWKPAGKWDSRPGNDTGFNTPDPKDYWHQLFMVY